MKIVLPARSNPTVLAASDPIPVKVAIWMAAAFPMPGNCASADIMASCAPVGSFYGTR